MNHIQFLKRIGAKGGKARALRPDRSELARKAALKRWSQNDATKPAEHQNTTRDESK